MKQVDNSKYEQYLVYPNESIDKITVNRTFERLFDAIDSKTTMSSLKVEPATDKSYGTAKMSPSAAYLFDEPQSEDVDYSGSMLNVSQLLDMSKRLSDGTSETIYAAPVSADGDESLPLSSNRYWVKSDYMNSKFIFMPNGVNIVTCSFDVGFNGLSDALDDESIVTEDVTTPIPLSGYNDDIYVDAESLWNIEDFINDNNNFEDIADAENLINMDGRSMEIPFMGIANVTLRHNRCDSTRYSAYRRSYVEVCMSFSLSVKSLFDSKYGKSTYELVSEDSSISEEKSLNVDEMGRKFRLFTQKPMVMTQMCFYNNNSNPKPVFGFDNRLGDDDDIKSRFSSHSQLSQKPVDEIDEDGSMVSPVNGNVLLKRLENVYDPDGNIIDNVITIDVIMKFMAGSASDPEMEYAMKSLNSRSRVQIAMIGV